MNKNELSENKHIKIGKDKLKRIGMYIFCLASVFFTLYISNNKIENILDVLKGVFVCITSAILYLYINILAFMPLFYNTQELENVD